MVILNWNGRKHLETFLPSVIAFSSAVAEIIVADNGSTDDSISYITAHHRAVKVIPLDKNYGFARGYNETLKQVQADYYVILNSDVEVTAGWLQPMMELLESNTAIAACQPKILSYNNKNIFEYAGAAGGWIDRFGYPFARGRVFDICEEDHGQYDEPGPVFWASGAALFIRSSVFHAMKGFDEYFFAHQEEIDLCWRIQAAGQQVWSCPESVVYHLGGGTLPKGNSRKTYLNFRNNRIMLSKNLPWQRKLWVMPLRNLLDAVSAWKGLLRGDPGYFIAVVRAHAAFIKWWLFFKRRSVFPVKKMYDLPGIFKGNIAWRHFVKKQKTFGEIVRKTG